MWWSVEDEFSFTFCQRAADVQPVALGITHTW